MVKHPIQPAVLVNGVLRFKENKIVDKLLDIATENGYSLNDIASDDNTTKEDYEQLMQLIGYSISGAPSSVSDETAAVAELMGEIDGPDEKSARIEYLEDKLSKITNGLRGPVADLFGIHPDDLDE